MPTLPAEPLANALGTDPGKILLLCLLAALIAAGGTLAVVVVMLKARKANGGGNNPATPLVVMPRVAVDKLESSTELILDIHEKLGKLDARHEGLDRKIGRLESDVRTNRSDINRLGEQVERLIQVVEEGNGDA